jgi:hypothetical protein
MWTALHDPLPGLRARRPAQRWGGAWNLGPQLPGLRASSEEKDSDAGRTSHSGISVGAIQEKQGARLVL